jgi:protein SCO1
MHMLQALGKAMNRARGTGAGGALTRRSVAVAAILLAIFPLVLAGCKKSQPAGTAEQEPAGARHYQLVGKVVSIDTSQNSITVDSLAVPGFMDAMIMPYSVHNQNELTTLHPGDQITADIVVTNDGAYLQHIVVTKPAGGTTAAPQAAPTSEHDPQPGEKVPDVVLINQDGKRIHLKSFKGDVVLVTFIYTRCPFPTYCPLVSQNFADIYAAIRKNPALNAKVRLLSVSFDPEHDTPQVLREYSERFRGTTKGIPFARWEFTAVPRNELPDVAKFFGLYLDTSNGQITHSLSTTVISPEGTVYKWYDDNSWKPSDLVADASQSLAADKADKQVVKGNKQESKSNSGSAGN